MLNQRPNQPSKTDVPKKSSRRAVPARPDTSRAENEGMPSAPDGEVEGEGSYTAAERYKQGLERSVEEGATERLGKNAADALDGPEGEGLRKAEKAAKRGHSV